MDQPIILAVAATAGLLGLVAALSPLARRLGLPYTVMLALVGLGTGAAVLVAGHEEALRLPSDVFFYVFLPPLLFHAGLSFDVRRLAEEFAPVLTLAVVAVVVCTALAGLALVAVAPAQGLLACLLLGAIVATTDTAAVLSVFRDIGAPRRLSTLVEGESLFNDATAIAIFVVLLAALTGEGAGDPMSGLGTFVFGLLGGVAVGIALGRLYVAVTAALREAAVVEITLSVALAWLAFVLAAEVLGVSGIIAVVAAAMTVAALGPTRLSPGGFEALSAIWRQLDHWATALIFVFAAIAAAGVLETVGPADLAAIGALFAATLAARALVLFGGLPLLSLARLTQPIGAAYKLVMLWGGVRGAVTIALALAVSEDSGLPEALRRFVLVTAVGYVVLTLFVQATTLRPLMRALGLARLSERDRLLRDQAAGGARARAAEAAHALARRLGLPPPEATQPATCDLALPIERRAELGLFVLSEREGELALAQRRGGQIDRDTADILRTEAGRLFDGLKSGGEAGYGAAARRLADASAAFRLPLLLQNRFGWRGPLAAEIARRVEVMLAKDLLLADLLQFAGGRLAGLVGSDAVARILPLVDRRREAVRANLALLDLQYPDYIAGLRRLFLARAALGVEETEYRELRGQSLISQDIYEELEAARAARGRGLMRRPPLDLGLVLADMIARVPLFADLPRPAIEALGRMLSPRLSVPGERILRAGERGREMFFLASGSAEVSVGGRTIRLKPGDYFGEMALVGDGRRTADVTAVSYVTMLVLSRGDLNRLARREPQLKARLEQTARDRAAENRSENGVSGEPD